MESPDVVSPTPAIALLKPSAGTPLVITTDEQLSDAIDALSAGNGPFAVDAERASGYKYSARAYLIQIKRNGGGLHLIDPIPFHFNSEKTHALFDRLNALLETDEVILHASTQDLPCLREVGLHPTRLFDTELAGRIAGLPRVGLGPLVESLLGITLAKEHSAVDWSIRPLPVDWLTYAALDVELLIELREKIGAILDAQGKSGWATEEFAAILSAAAAGKRQDPWRRTSGMHKVKRRNVLAIVRSLWFERDDRARDLDVAPSKLLSDAAIMELAIHAPKNRKEMEKVLRPIGARARWFENAKLWITAIEVGVSLPESEWPEVRAGGETMPPVKLWREKFPTKYAPLSHARALIDGASKEHNLPAENLITPDLVRRVCWDPPTGSTRIFSPEPVNLALVALGARRWQCEIVAPLIAQALLEKEPLPAPPPATDPEE